MTIFRTKNIHLYQDDYICYLDNGTLKKVTQGQANTIVSKINGMTDEQAEKYIMALDIGTETPLKFAKIKHPCITEVLLKNGAISYSVQIKIRGKYLSKTFKELSEAIKWRDEIRNEVPPTGKPCREYIEKYITKFVRKYLVRFVVKFKFADKHYSKSFKTLEQAIEWRDTIIK